MHTVPFVSAIMTPNTVQALVFLFFLPFLFIDC
jgi:hypothetical protein